MLHVQYPDKVLMQPTWCSLLVYHALTLQRRASVQGQQQFIAQGGPSQTAYGLLLFSQRRLGPHASCTLASLAWHDLSTALLGPLSRVQTFHLALWGFVSSIHHSLHTAVVAMTDSALLLYKSASRFKRCHRSRNEYTYVKIISCRSRQRRRKCCKDTTS